MKNPDFLGALENKHVDGPKMIGSLRELVAFWPLDVCNPKDQGSLPTASLLWPMQPNSFQGNLGPPVERIE